MSFSEYFYERLRNRGFIAVLGVFLTACAVSATYWTLSFDLRNLLMSIIYMLFVPLTLLVEWKTGIRLGTLFAAAVFFMAFGSILGSAFDFYTIIPFFDTLLHGMAGLLFAALGFSVAECFFRNGDERSARHFLGCLAFAICFSLAIAVLWELIEYAGTVFCGFDMMEDTYINEINSYLLAGSHNETVLLEGITKTVIYYGDGQLYEIVGSYLDIGLLDTLTDMSICTFGAVVFGMLALIGRKCSKLREMLIPRLKR